MKDFWCTIFFSYVIFTHTICDVQCKATDPEVVSLTDKPKIGQRIFRNESKEEIDVPQERDWSNTLGAVYHLLSDIKDVCSNRTRDCDALSMYRTMDGTCNNLDYPYIGSSSQPYSRLLPAGYSDGVNEPRGGRTNSSLPSARLVSTTVHRDLILTDLLKSITTVLPIFGLFLQNDMSFTPVKDKPCCSGDPDIDCWPIPIYQNDTLFSSHGKTCKNFTRSAAYCYPDSSAKSFGANGVREQYNRQTAYLDLSNVYGSDDKQLRYLRENFWPEFFRRYDNKNRELTVPDVEKEFFKSNSNGKFLNAGKTANESLSLHLMHILFLLEHKDTVDRLQLKNLHWNENRLFHEARRIVIAEYQNIIYNEYLPGILDSSTMIYFNLSLPNGSPTSYIKNVDPSISNAFAIAANQFGGPMIDPLNDVGFLFEITDTVVEEKGLRFNKFIQRKDKHYGSIKHSKFAELFRIPDELKNVAADLIEKNLQRGRDHGLPSYSKFRQICSLAHLTNWENRPVEILPDTWKLFSELYGSPKDIDLFSAGILEIPKEEAAVGPTFSCLLGIQFNCAKFGDRFFFTHGGQRGSFTEKQRENIRRRTLRDIICTVMLGNVMKFRALENVFRIPGLKNPYQSCKFVNELNMEYWREEPNV